MKKIGIIFLLCALLCGCAAAPTYETLGGDIHQAAISLKEAVVSVPEGAAEMAMEQGTYWVCDDFDLQVQTLSGGDLGATVSALSGLDVFSQKAIDEVYRISTGIPRQINRVCEKCLMYSFQQQRRIIDDTTVRYVADHEMLKVKGDGQ